MCTAFYDFTFVDKEYHIRVFNRGKAVGYRDDGTFTGDIFDGLLDLLFRMDINGSRGLVEYDNR